ncbi:SMC family ATPase [Microbacterium terrisoli]|uniref:SMC family ATPase n=1 Tax=Microbacterium terrisoli TaxID=3242192 RepID=UPI00280412FA|nr:SMC family ATPase [Microbacterium protaetiae]
MKLHRLQIEGFGPFLQRQTVDFDAFDDDGIFLIAGRTGAGKSSILDGVGFALYGGVPRYDGGAKRLRSDHCGPEDRTEVVLEFTVGDRRWRVTRAPEYERPKKNGKGTTIEDHRALVEELVDGDWVARAAKPREAAELLDEILGLNREQFQQVILLAQNRFARFLLARNDDRQALLRTLFGSRRYQDYERALEQRRKDAEDAVSGRRRDVEAILDAAEATVAAYGFGGSEARSDASTSVDGSAAGASAAEAAMPSVADRIAQLDRARDRGRYQVEALQSARTEALHTRDSAVTAHEELRRTHERVAARLGARDALAALEARADEIAQARRTLDDARRADALRSVIEAAARDEQSAARRSLAEDDARTLWAAHGGAAVADSAALETLVDELTGSIAVWQAALAHEQTLAAHRAQLEAAEKDAAAAAARIGALDEQRAALPGRRAELDAAVRTHGDLAATLEDARAAVDDAAGRLAAAQDAQACQAAMHDAEKTQLAADDAAAEADAAARELLRRRVAERAGELAAGLVDDEPCPVCGSLAHPHPAERAPQPVTDDELERAESEKSAAQDRARAAAEAASAARAALAAAAGRAAGLDVASARAAADVATARFEAAERAVRLRDTARTARAALDDEADLAEREVADLRARRSELSAQVTTLAERVRTSEAAIDAARGDFDSVADRIADGERRRQSAIDLRAAIDAAATARAAARASREDLDARVAASAFADAAAARSALRDEAVRDELEKTITEHGNAVEVQRARLMQLEIELAGAPEPLPGLAESEAGVAAARAAADAATAAAAGAALAVTSLDEAAGRAGRAHDAIAELEQRRRLIAGVANAVAGRNDRKMDLETFVLAAELEQIVAAANLRLEDMSSGRYRLRHTDALAARNAASGLGLEVVDAFTGQARPAQSLSGGETFLASLALALGLAQVVTDRAGGIRLDTLFIDEGFGSLDPETLDLAMRTLDELRQGGRTVGVISHVEAMKEQLPAQLIVEAGAHGPSTIRQGALDPA